MPQIGYFDAPIKGGLKIGCSQIYVLIFLLCYEKGDLAKGQYAHLSLISPTKDDGS